MPLFSDPTEPHGLRQARRQLLRYGALLLALMGWCTLALGLAQQGSAVWWLAAPGLLASLFAGRAPKVTAAAEILLLATGLTLLPSAAISWGVTAAALVLLARGAAMAERLRQRTG